jgi:SAM-dependent methyltransferase
MQHDSDPFAESRHLRVTEPSPWVCRFAPLVPAGGAVLDLACGNGRQARHFLGLGHRIILLDKAVEALADLNGDPRAEVIRADLEDGNPVFDPPGPLAGRSFAGVVVTNYLYRPLLPRLLDALAGNGVLIYETFARGNERFTRPRNPDHLLKSGELLELVRGRLQIVAYEHGIVERGPLPGVIQRIAAVNDLGRPARADGEPEPHKVPP